MTLWRTLQKLSSKHDRVRLLESQMLYQVAELVTLRNKVAFLEEHAITKQFGRTR